MKRTAMAGLLALVSWSAAQAAQDVPGWRVGAAASFTDFSWTDGDTDLIDDAAIGAKLWANYQFNDWFAVEGAYHNTGEFEDISLDPDTLGTLNLSFTGFSLVGMVFLPIETEGVKFYAKAGYYDFDDELSLNGSVTSNGSESGLTAGAGATIAITDHFGIRADFDWFDAEVGDLWAANLGLEYSFGGPKAAPMAAAAAPAAAPAEEPPPPPPPPPPPADSDGDGVVDPSDQCPGTPAGAKVNARGCEEQLVLQGVTFENNSAKLTPDSTLTLDSVAAIIKQRPNFKVEVRGHTDSAGSDEYNMDLSQRRAEAVMDYLVGEGVDPGKLSANGYGETQPVASNDTAEGRAQNRRVALEFTESN